MRTTRVIALGLACLLGSATLGVAAKPPKPPVVPPASAPTPPPTPSLPLPLPPAVDPLVAPPLAALCALPGLDPCLAKRSKAFSFWGPYSDVQPAGRSLTVTIRSFGLVTGPLRRALAAHVGDDVEIGLVKATRAFVVDPDGRKTRQDLTTFVGVLDAYERATVYPTAVLRRDSTWADEMPRMVASTITVDLSDLRDPLPDLESSWALREDGRTVELAPVDTDGRAYDATVTKDGVPVETFRLSLSDASTACVTDWLPQPDDGRRRTFTCGPVSLDAAAIGPLAFSGSDAGDYRLTRMR